jgi:hypothetical protein
VRINYVIASWSGPRRGGTTPNSVNYVKHHIEVLSTLKHNLTQITVGYPHNPNESPEYSEFINTLETNTSCNTPIKVFRVSNGGASYGQWSKVADYYKDAFDYYIFVEDDYFPAIDCFDSDLVTIFKWSQKYRNCGYLSALSWGNGRLKDSDFPEHAGMSTGITDYESIQRVCNKFQKLPYHQWNFYQSQIVFGCSFVEAGMNICDWLHGEVKPYRSIYWSDGAQSIKGFGIKDAPDLFLPYQFIEGHKPDDSNWMSMFRPDLAQSLKV